MIIAVDSTNSDPLSSSVLEVQEETQSPVDLETTFDSISVSEGDTFTSRVQEKGV